MKIYIIITLLHSLYEIFKNYRFLHQGKRSNKTLNTAFYLVRIGYIPYLFMDGFSLRIIFMLLGIEIIRILLVALATRFILFFGNK